jgi:hypothetical protein
MTNLPIIAPRKSNIENREPKNKEHGFPLEPCGNDNLEPDGFLLEACRNHNLEPDGFLLEACRNNI